MPDTPSLAPLLVANIPTHRIFVAADGTGTFHHPAGDVRLGRTEGLFALRLFYRSRIDGAAVDEPFQRLADILRPNQRCARPDCSNLVPVDKRIRALESHCEAKWCSLRCYKTEVARRYNERLPQLYIADPELRCARPRCRAPIPPRRQINGLARKMPAKWCSRRCAHLYRRAKGLS